MNMIAVQKEYYRRNPEPVEKLVRAYVDGLAFMHRNKDRAIQIITKHSRLNDAKMIEQFYDDAVTYLDRIPEPSQKRCKRSWSYGQERIPAETFQDNSIVDKLAREGFFEKIFKKS